MLLKREALSFFKKKSIFLNRVLFYFLRENHFVFKENITIYFKKILPHF